jgi:riboflavin kinase / FMN adenylyltransferase
LDFAGELYGCEIALCFVQRLRGVVKFPDAATLIKAIEHDVAATRALLATVNRDLVKPLLNTETERA